MPDYFETGFSVREPMWHGKGNILEDHPADWDEARKLAGLTWEPMAIPVYTRTLLAPGEERPEGTIVLNEDPLGTDAMVPADGFQAVARDDTGAVLGVPTDNYQVIGNGQMGELLEAIVDQGADVKFETAGSADGGKQVWAMVRLDEPFQPSGDDSMTYPFFTLLNNHGGGGACKALPTMIRVVCRNTFQAADELGDRTGFNVVINHVGDVEARIEAAKLMLARAREAAFSWAAEADDLVHQLVSPQALGVFLEEFIPTPEGALERTVASRAERRAQVRRLWEQSPTAADLPDSAYKLVQVAGEYLDHLRPSRDKSPTPYLKRTMLSPDVPLKARVIELARDVAAEHPLVPTG